MSALVLSLSTARAAQVRHDIDLLEAAGHDVELIVTKGERWDDLPKSVIVHSLDTVEYRHPVLRAERFVVLTLPRLVYTAVAKVLTLLARVLPGPIGRRMARVGGQWKRLWIRTREGTKRFHKEKWAVWYGHVRPWFLWRITRRHVVPELAGNWDVILVADALSTPVGWQLAQTAPSASVGFTLEEVLDVPDGVLG